MASGLIAERLGAKWVMFGFISVSTISMLLTPVAAELGYIAVIVVRIVAGIGSVSLCINGLCGYTLNKFAVVSVMVTIGWRRGV